MKFLRLIFLFAVTTFPIHFSYAEPAAPTVAAANVTDVLPEVLRDAKGKKIEAATLEGKFVGLYFSAHWCPPCRAFTPSLVKFRNKHEPENFEVVFVSLDKSNTDKSRYIREAKMEWPSIDGAGSKEAKALAEQFRIQGIPSLIILAPDGTLVTASGREDVMMTPDTALAGWKAAES